MTKFASKTYEGTEAHHLSSLDEKLKSAVSYKVALDDV